MRALVTGCAGFIGSHTCERLLADGWHVRGVDSFSSYYAVADKEANLVGIESDPRFSLVRADLATVSLHPLLADADAVIHLAGQPGVRTSFGAEFAACDRDNILATQRVLEAALETNCRRVVLASSSSVYGDAPRFPCRETSRLYPRSPYAVTKRACEDLAAVYRELGLDVVVLRYFTVYGPRQRPDMAMRRLCVASVGGDPFELYGDGRQVRDFTHVDDAVDATVRAITAGAAGPILNVGGGRQATMLDVIELVGGLVGASVPVRIGASQRGDVARTGADTTLARLQLGWAPQVELFAGLRSELDWVRARHHRRPSATTGRAS